jgi:hypothetical protein
LEKGEVGCGGRVRGRLMDGEKGGGLRVKGSKMGEGSAWRKRRRVMLGKGERIMRDGKKGRV